MAKALKFIFTTVTPGRGEVYKKQNGAAIVVYRGIFRYFPNGIPGYGIDRPRYKNK